MTPGFASGKSELTAHRQGHFSLIRAGELGKPTFCKWVHTYKQVPVAGTLDPGGITVNADVRKNSRTNIRNYQLSYCKRLWGFLRVSCEGHPHCVPFSTLSFLSGRTGHRPGMKEVEQLLGWLWNWGAAALEVLPKSFSWLCEFCVKCAQ